LPHISHDPSHDFHCNVDEKQKNAVMLDVEAPIKLIAKLSTELVMNELLRTARMRLWCVWRRLYLWEKRLKFCGKKQS
jgi:hypothetical protein